MRVPATIVFSLVTLWCAFRASTAYELAVRTHHEYHSAESALWLAGAVAAALITFFATRIAPPAPRPLPQLARESHDVRTRGFRPIAVPGIVARPGETFFYYRNPANVIAEEYHTQYVTASLALSARIAASAYVVPGAGSKVPEPVPVAIADVGKLMMSNERLLYVGHRMTYDVARSLIVDVTHFIDGMRLSISNSAPLIFVTGHPDGAVIVHRIALNDIGEHAPMASVVSS